MTPQPNNLLVACFAIAVAIEFIFPFVVAGWFAHRFGCRWKNFGIGVLVFLLFQGITRVPVMLVVQSLPPVIEALKQPFWFWSFIAIASLTAGIFEEGGRWLALRYVIPADHRHWRTAVMMGAGHGGLESIGVGVLVLLALVNYLALIYLPVEAIRGQPAQVEAARQQFASLTGWEPLMGAWERVCTLAIQIALTVMVLQSFVRGRRWWYYALAAHTLINFIGVGMLKLLSGAFGTTAAMLIVEGFVGLLALASLSFIRRFRDEPGRADPQRVFMVER